MPETMLLTQATGSFDHSKPVDQMQAIDLILCFYFQRSDWLWARAEARQKRRSDRSTR